MHSARFAALSTLRLQAIVVAGFPLHCVLTSTWIAIPPLLQAIVVVGFPATPLLTTRMRVCISAAHSRADLDYALEVFKALLDRWASDHAMLICRMSCTCG